MGNLSPKTAPPSFTVVDAVRLIGSLVFKNSETILIGNESLCSATWYSGNYQLFNSHVLLVYKLFKSLYGVEVHIMEEVNYTTPKKYQRINLKFYLTLF